MSLEKEIELAAAEREKQERLESDRRRSEQELLEKNLEQRRQCDLEQQRVEGRYCNHVLEVIKHIVSEADIQKYRLVFWPKYLGVSEKRNPGNDNLGVFAHSAVVTILQEQAGVEYFDAYFERWCDSQVNLPTPSKITKCRVKTSSNPLVHVKAYWLQTMQDLPGFAISNERSYWPLSNGGPQLDVAQFTSALPNVLGMALLEHGQSTERFESYSNDAVNFNRRHADPTEIFTKLFQAIAKELRQFGVSSNKR